MRRLRETHGHREALIRELSIAAAQARLAAGPLLCTSPSGAAPPAPAVPAVPVQANCEGCGQVAAVAGKEEAGNGGPVGLVAGGVGSGKDIATIAGAAGGA